MKNYLMIGLVTLIIGFYSPTQAFEGESFEDVLVEQLQADIEMCADLAPELDLEGKTTLKLTADYPYSVCLSIQKSQYQVKAWHAHNATTPALLYRKARDGL